jgi:hypothetical protein
MSTTVANREHLTVGASSGRRGTGPDCTTELPDDWESELCPLHLRALELLTRLNAKRCEARGDGWECTEAAETQVYGKYCVAHYKQVHRGKEVGPVRRRLGKEERFEGWAAVLRENGWTVHRGPCEKEEQDGQA